MPKEVNTADQLEPITNDEKHELFGDGETEESPAEKETSPAENADQEGKQGIEEEAGTDDGTGKDGDDTVPGEPEPGETAVEEEPEFDLSGIEDEELRERVREDLQKGVEAAQKVEKLDTRTQQLESKIGVQGSELGTLRKMAEQGKDELSTKLMQADEQYNGIMDNLETQLETAKDQGDKKLQRKIEDAIVQQRGVYQSGVWELTKNHADSVETAFLESAEKYVEVQPKFEGFLADHGLNIIGIKSDPKLLAQWYDALWNMERGKNLDNLTAKATAAKIKSAANVKNAQIPGTGKSGKAPTQKEDDFGITWNTGKKRSGGVV